MLSAVLSIYFPFLFTIIKNADFLYGFPQGQIRKKKEERKMQTKEELLQHKEIDGEMLKAAYDKAAELITIATDEFTEKFPSSASIHNFYRPGRN